MEFHPQTFVKFVPSNSFCKGVYNFGSHTDFKSFKTSSFDTGGVLYTDIEHINLFENQSYGDYIMIIKIPVEFPIIQLNSDRYKSFSIFVESIHLYTDFLQDDTLFTDLKKSMKRVDIRMPLHQNKENCLEAVQRDGNNIQYALASPLLDSESLKEICLEAVKNDSCSIRYIKDSSNATLLLDKEFCLAAVRKNESAIRYILSSSIGAKLGKEICLEAVKNNPFSIVHILSSSIGVKLVDKEICSEAVKKDVRSIQYMWSSPIFDTEFCLAAVKQNLLAIKYIPEKFLTEEFIKQFHN